MSAINDARYYAARAKKAGELAKAARDPAIAAIHRRMAAGYRELVTLANQGRPLLRIVTK